MTAIAERLATVRTDIAAAARDAARDPADICLIAVSKRHPATAIAEAYAAGQRDFGENYIHELLEKKRALGGQCPGIIWHFIGRVQSNKARDIVLSDVVHGVGAARHLAALRRRAGGPVDYFAQVNAAGEQAKNGFSPTGLAEFVHGLDDPAWRPLGLMAMGPLGADPEPTFAAARSLVQQHGPYLRRGALSMGMSADFRAAIRYGATHVRIGTAIFGPRPA